MELNKIEAPEEIATNFFRDRDIQLLEEKINDIKRFITSLVYTNDRLQRQFNQYSDEKWMDNTLQEMKQELTCAKNDLYRGFPISEEDANAINKWQLKHDEEVHNNFNHYHGCSGGGYEYNFYPTGIGTASHCVCSSCKKKAISEKGVDWFDYCNKELHGIFRFGDF